MHTDTPDSQWRNRDEFFTGREVRHKQCVKLHGHVHICITCLFPPFFTLFFKKGNQGLSYEEVGQGTRLRVDERIVGLP